MIRDVDPQKLIESAAKKMEAMTEFKPPAWSSLVKTGVAKERPPQQKNWWWIRSASILRKLYISSKGMGTSRMKREYSSRKNRGHKPEHRFPASGNITRKMLQQLEAAGFVKTEKGKGRIITPQGQVFLNSAAKEAKK